MSRDGNGGLVAFKNVFTTVGNAHIWVTDTAAEIKPGDYLISSAVPGHAPLLREMNLIGAAIIPFA